MLTGDFSSQPQGLSDEEVAKWEVAKAWDAAMTQTKATRPSAMTGIRSLQDLRSFESLLCPFSLGSEVMLKRMSDDEKVKKRAEAESKLLEWLGQHGF